MNGRTVTVEAPARKPRLSNAARFLYLMWFINLFGPQWLVASLGPSMVLKIPTPLFAALLLVAISKGPRRLMTPLLVFLAYTVLSVPMAYIRGQALEVAKAVFAFYVMALATVTIVRNAREALPIVLWSLALQYGVWVILGARSGGISWHVTYFNYDSFGPLMDLGICGVYWVAMSQRSRKWRTLAYLTIGGCIMGLVVSFARGAVLSAGAVALWIWFRSPNKLRTALLGVGAVIVLMIAANVFNGAQSAVISGKKYTNFWEEMGSSFDPTEGTRQDREVLWHLAMRVYASHPLFGVGPNCFGAYAADNFAAGTVGGAYNENPKTLWGRALHNTYYQILSEFGTVGAAIFLWIVWDFFRRNRKLRDPRRVQSWAVQTNGKYDLKCLSYALESSMVAFLLTAYFYNQIFDTHWLYTLLTINTLLYYLSRPQPVAAARTRLSA